MSRYGAEFCSAIGKAKLGSTIATGVIMRHRAPISQLALGANPHAIDAAVDR
jgi:hypothetical protein